MGDDAYDVFIFHRDIGFKGVEQFGRGQLATAIIIV